jgi:hypothetical protein
MLLRTLKLQNYKGFGSPQQIEFAKPGADGLGGAGTVAAISRIIR